MTNKELFYFLGKCLALGENEKSDRAVMNAIRKNKVDWKRFVAAASDHLVLPSVYLRFKRHGIIPYLSGELADHLRMVYELNYLRNTEALKQIDRINRLLATMGIVPIYLKGAGNLLDDLYEDIGERMIGDIDLLVSDAEFLPAAYLLKKNGYGHKVPFFEDDIILKHFPRMLHPNESLAVEVHRVPVDTDLADHLNYTIVSAKKKPVEKGAPCFVLSDRHKVVLNFLHGFMARDVRLMQMVTYRNMVDFLLLSHRVDVYEALARRKQYASNAFVYADYVFQAMGVSSGYHIGFRSRVFIMRHDLLMRSKFLFRLSWLFKYLFSRIWSGYVKNAFGIFFSRRVRKSVFRRLNDPTWYRAHLKTYSTSFQMNFHDIKE